MSYAASASESGLRVLLLAARDARQQKLQRAFAQARTEQATVIAVATNLPGPRKHRLGLSHHVATALRAMQAWPGFRSVHAGPDPLGPFHVVLCNLAPGDAKALALALEEDRPASRLLDVDVYTPEGLQVDRAALGLSPRSCLLCPEPAGECIRLQRHAPEALQVRVEELLEPIAIPAQERLAGALVRGATLELELTPKPGLVDQHDQGSHPDLSLEAMRASVALLPDYFEALQQGLRERQSLDAFVQHGIEAESRMYGAIATNAHKGYIFLAGLALLASAESGGQVTGLRRGIARLAKAFFSRHAISRGTGGIRAEAESGLPALFEQGWPRYQAALDAGWEHDEAGFYLMAVLMQHVEDTTAIHRCGSEGLARLRADGDRLQRLLERRESPYPMLRQLNEDYRRTGLTMGGVADCMALTFALEERS